MRPSMRPYRIAFLLRDAGEGGAERSSLRLADGLSRRGHSVCVFFINARGPMLGAISRGIETVDLRGRFFAFFFELAARKFDFLLPVYTSMRSLLAKRFMNRGALRGMKVILSQRNMFTMDRNPIQTKLRFARCRLLYPQASVCVCISRGVAEEMARLGLLPEEKIRVVYNPVVTDGLKAQMFEPIPPGPLGRFGLDGRAEILGVGRLGSQKDFATLVKAFSICAAQRDDIRLTILGEGKQRESLEKLAQALGIKDRVSLPGYVANPYPFMRKAALAVSTSLFEGFCNVVAEALACGCNVVSTDCPSGPSEILDGGKYGFLAKTGDPDDVAAKMQYALKSPLAREALMERAEFFSEARAVDGYCEIFESLFCGSRQESI
ncbi:MAG: glycosyltransferase [Synergistaceae bacterium]|nr:glycosyltransferase [Synergistaceae bacterium]